MGDLRTARTYKLLKDSLLQLLSEKSFDNIKVNDICDLAMVHRTTFYSHFSDKYELLDTVFKYNTKIKRRNSKLTNNKIRGRYKWKKYYYYL